MEAPQGAEDSEEDSDFEDEPPEATSSNADGRGSGTATNPLGLPLTHNIELKGNPSHLESKETKTELHDVLSCNVNISIVSFPYRKGEIFLQVLPSGELHIPGQGSSEGIYMQFLFFVFCFFSSIVSCFQKQPQEPSATQGPELSPKSF